MHGTVAVDMPTLSTRPTCDRRSWLKLVISVTLLPGSACRREQNADDGAEVMSLEWSPDAQIARYAAHEPASRSITVPRSVTEPMGAMSSTRSVNDGAPVRRLLRSLPCLCSCQHDSLQACFDAGHGTTCHGCLDQRRFALRLHRQRYSVDEIARKSREHFRSG